MSAPVHSPIPDLQSLQGAYVGNISRLEEHAERMSEAGSDLHDEIRKLHAELKASDSRRSSIHSGRSRNLSNSSHTGAFSPTAYVTSPVAHVASPTASLRSISRHRSGSRSSRLAQVVHPEQVPEPGASFTRRYDEIAREMRDLPDRPPTAASTDTTVQARTLWHDFDGTHAPDTVMEEDEPDHHHHHHHHHPHSPHSPPGVPPPDDGMVFYPAPVPRMLNLPKRLSQLPASDVAARRRTQVLDQIQAENRKSAPWLTSPDAPKPRNTRKSFAGLPAQLRASAFFDQQGPAQDFDIKGDSAQDTLDSILEASARAPVSAFTDHPFNPTHNRKSTKLSLVDPVFVEPPPKRRSSFNILDTNTNSSGAKLNKLKKRNSSADMNILVARAAESRMSLGAELDDPDDPDAHARAPDPASRRNSLDDDHDDHDDDERRDADLQDLPEDHDASPEEPEEEDPQHFFGAPTTLLAELQLRKAKQKERNMNYVTMVEEGKITSHRTLLDLNDDAEREHQRRLKKKVQLAWEAQDDDSEDDIPLGVLYKQPQRNDWNRPLGLIAQRELEENEPLSRRRERLTGLPATRRAANLGPYDSQTNLDIPRVVTPQPDDDDDEHVGETLGERRRRLQEKQVLEAALGDDVRKSTVSTDFAAEMLSKLGVDDSPKAAEGAPADAADAPNAPAPDAPGDAEEETLGQRRARLKAEAEARGDVLNPADRPILRSKMSLADVLSANPYDEQHQARKVSNEQLMSHLPAGSLLHQNALLEEKRKAQRLTQNMRASSFGIPAAPLVGLDSHAKDDDDTPLALKIQAYKDRMAGVDPRHSAFPMGMPMPMNPNPMAMTMGMQNMNMPMNMQMPMTGMQNMNMNMNMPMQMQMPLNPMAMNMPMNMSMNMPMNMQMPMNMPMNMNMAMDPNLMLAPMNPQQRNNIEGWMKGIR